MAKLHSPLYVTQTQVGLLQVNCRELILPLHHWFCYYFYLIVALLWSLERTRPTKYINKYMHPSQHVAIRGRIGHRIVIITQYQYLSSINGQQAKEGRNASDRPATPQYDDGYSDRSDDEYFTALLSGRVDWLCPHCYYNVSDPLTIEPQSFLSISAPFCWACECVPRDSEHDRAKHRRQSTETRSLRPNARRPRYAALTANPLHLKEKSRGNCMIRAVEWHAQGYEFGSLSHSTPIAGTTATGDEDEDFKAKEYEEKLVFIERMVAGFVFRCSSSWAASLIIPFRIRWISEP